MARSPALISCSAELHHLFFKAACITLKRMIKVAVETQQHKIKWQEKRTQNPILHTVTVLVEPNSRGRGDSVQDAIAHCERGNTQVPAHPQHRAAVKPDFHRLMPQVPSRLAGQAE